MIDLTALQPKKTVTGNCAGSCGNHDHSSAAVPQHIQEKIHNHPCYSEQAHHYYARMHVAVAPACNIQCHYCNRKYDCANESRPGVVSEVLKPDQAVKKVLAVGAAIPQMSVVGIAGPGDPLANPERTFATFRELTRLAPDLKLCVSTNGLALPQHVDELAKHNIDHVTITINCLDPEIGAKIYPWIFWNHRRIKGIKAAEILIRQQQQGLEMLVARGILVKINSVMIPGINDEHLKEVSRVVKAKGAFLHNIMPLIAEAKHGTFFGLSGQASPTAEELNQLQTACETDDMRMMRHCRQCRADAVGLLGEDRGDEFSLEKIEHLEIDYAAAMQRRQAEKARIEAEIAAKHVQPAKPVDNRVQLISLDSLRTQRKTYRSVMMAVASKGQGIINLHFGHAQEFLIYEASQAGVKFIRAAKAELYCTGDDTCGEVEGRIARIIKALAGCEVVLCAKIGYEPWGQLESAGIQPNGEHAMESIEIAVKAVYQEMMAAGKLDAVAAKQHTMRA